MVGSSSTAYHLAATALRLHPASLRLLRVPLRHNSILKQHLLLLLLGPIYLTRTTRSCLELLLVSLRGYTLLGLRASGTCTSPLKILLALLMHRQNRVDGSLSRGRLLRLVLAALPVNVLVLRLRRLLGEGIRCLGVVYGGACWLGFVKEVPIIQLGRELIEKLRALIQ